MFEGIEVYMSSMLKHYTAWGTGSSVVLVLWLLDSYYGWKIPKFVFVIFLAIGFFISGFQAWQEQYRENETARSAGTLSLDGIQLGLIKQESQTNGFLQLELNLKNLQNRLIEYRMETFEFTVDSKVADEHFVRKGGYVYANAPTMFRSGRVPISDTSQLLLSGTLKYAISYHAASSKEIHHSTKSLNFEFYTSPPPGRVQYAVTSEHED
jgi:predicted membrane metal-binding protein